jgi:hypothetical protein
VGLAVAEHPAVATRSGGASVLLPARGVDLEHPAVPVGQLTCQSVSTSAIAVDEHDRLAWGLGGDGRLDLGGQGVPVGPGAGAADQQSRTRSPPLGNSQGNRCLVTGGTEPISGSCLAPGPTGAGHALCLPETRAHGRWLPSCRVTLPMELSRCLVRDRAEWRWSRRASPWNKAAAERQARAGQGQAMKGQIRRRLFAEWIKTAAGGGFRPQRICGGFGPGLPLTVRRVLFRRSARSGG